MKNDNLERALKELETDKDYLALLSFPLTNTYGLSDTRCDTCGDAYYYDYENIYNWYNYISEFAGTDKPVETYKAMLKAAYFTVAVADIFMRKAKAQNKTFYIFKEKIAIRPDDGVFMIMYGKELFVNDVLRMSFATDTGAHVYISIGLDNVYVGATPEDFKTWPIKFTINCVHNGLSLKCRTNFVGNIMDHFTFSTIQNRLDEMSTRYNI